MSTQSVAKNGFSYVEFNIQDTDEKTAVAKFKKQHKVKEETIVCCPIENRKDTNIWYIKAELKENKETY